MEIFGTADMVNASLLAGHPLKARFMSDIHQTRDILKRVAQSGFKYEVTGTLPEPRHCQAFKVYPPALVLKGFCRNTKVILKVDLAGVDSTLHGFLFNDTFILKANKHTGFALKSASASTDRVTDDQPKQGI
jgi:hypothetical protein